MIYILSGKNTHQIKVKLDDIKKQFGVQHGSSAVEVIAGETLNPEQLSSVLLGQSLFSSSRLVVIKRLLSDNKNAAENFLDLVSSVPSETTVVLVEGELDKRTSAYKKLKVLPEFHEFGQPTEKELADFASRYVKEQAKKINPSALNTLLARVDMDQLRLSSELDKLCSYVDEEIKVDDVELLVQPSQRNQMFELLDNALAGRERKALDIIQDMKAHHQDLYQLVNMLIWQVHILAVVFSAKEIPDNLVAKEAKISPFVVGKTRSLARSMTEQQVDHIITVVARLDIKLKSSGDDPWRLLEQAIFALNKK